MGFDISQVVNFDDDFHDESNMLVISNGSGS